jgi:hypothetical protein
MTNNMTSNMPSNMTGTAPAYSHDWPASGPPSYSNFVRDQAPKPVEPNSEKTKTRAVNPHIARIEMLKGKVLDGLEAVLDTMAAARRDADNLALEQARRQLAHIVRAPEFCARKRCRRRKACCGEPKQCLAVLLPLLPPDKVEALLLDARPTRRGKPARASQL